MRLPLCPHFLSYAAPAALLIALLLMLPVQAHAASEHPCMALLAPAPPARVTPVQADDLARHRAIPAALFGIIVGAHHATGPRETRVAFTAIENKAQAVAAYRRCRTEATLRSLSN